jgi:hypothetical protein
MIREHPGKDLPDVLAGLSELVFHEDFDARFLDGGIQNYQTATGQLSANPVQLHAT